MNPPLLSFREPVDEQKERAAADDCCKDNGILALLAPDGTHNVIEDGELGAYRIDLAMNICEKTPLLHDAPHRSLGAPNNLHRHSHSHTNTHRVRYRDIGGESEDSEP